MAEISTKWRRRGIWAVWIAGGAGFGLFALSIPFVLPALRRYCLPYVPATPIQIEKILHQLKGRHGKMVDLGSGDGRVVSGNTLLNTTEHCFVMLGHSCSPGGPLCCWLRVECVACALFQSQSSAWWSTWKNRIPQEGFVEG